MNKRVLIVPPNDLLRHPIPNRLYHIAKYLSRKHDITILSYPEHPLGDGILRKISAKEVEYKAISVKDLGFYYIVNSPSMFLTLKNIIKEIDVIIHANILPSLIATMLAKRYGKTTIYDYVDHFPESASAYYRGPIRDFVRKGVMVLVLEAIRNSMAIVTPSFGLASFIRQYTRKPIYVIPNGVDPELFRPMDLNLARKSISIDYDGPILLLYGSIDVWLEIESILYTMKKNKDVRLLIVGYSHGKYYYSMLESLIRRLGIEDRVYRYPPQSYEKMPLFVNASNVIVAPFTREIISYATPLKIIESLACARPVMTVNIPEFKLWFRRGLYYYSSPGDAYKVLSEIIRNFDYIQTQLLSYSKIIREKHSWKNITEAYSKIIEDLHHDISSHRYKA